MSAADNMPNIVELTAMPSLDMVETRDHDDDLGIRGEGKVTGLVEAVDSSEQLSPGLCNTS